MSEARQRDKKMLTKQATDESEMGEHSAINTIACTIFLRTFSFVHIVLPW